MVAIIKSSIYARHGIDRAIWIALLCVVGTAIFSIALLQLAIGVLAALWLVAFVRSSSVGFRSTVLDLPMLAFISGRALSVPFSVHPEISAHALYIEIIFYAAFFVFTNTLRVDRENEMIILIQMLVLTAVLAAAVGIGKYAFGISQRASSTTSGPYTLSLYLVAALPFALFFAGDSRFFKNRQYAFAAIAVLVLGVIFSLDRMHWIVMAATLVVVAIITKDRRPLIAFVLVMTAAVLVVPEVALRFQLTLTFLSHSTGRDVLWRGAAMLYADHPLVGFGPRTFREIFPLMSELSDKGAGSWHNDFLQVYMESGLVGLVPLLWLITAAFSSVIKAFRSTKLSLLHRQILFPLLVSASVFFIAGGMLDTIVGMVFRFNLAAIALMTTGLGNKSVWEPNLRQEVC